MPTSKEAQDLLGALARELLSSERGASRHARLEAERLGQSPPGVIMDEIAIHAERSLEQVEEWARRRGIRSAVSESVASRALTNVRERFSELAMSVEQSYRMSLLGMRHSVDLIRLIRELAVLADDRDLREWSERWSLRRLDLLEQAEMALGWFAEHPGRALEPVKSTLVAQVARTMLKAVSRTDQRAQAS